MPATGNSSDISAALLPVRYLVGAAAITVLASALIAASLGHRSPAKPVTATSVAGSNRYSLSEVSRSVIYLVGSRSEAAVLERAIASDSATYNQIAKSSVFLIDRPEKEFLADTVSRELAPFAPSSLVVDLRAR